MTSVNSSSSSTSSSPSPSTTLKSAVTASAVEHISRMDDADLCEQPPAKLALRMAPNDSSSPLLNGVSMFDPYSTSSHGYSCVLESVCPTPESPSLSTTRMETQEPVRQNGGSRRSSSRSSNNSNPCLVLTTSSTASPAMDTTSNTNITITTTTTASAINVDPMATPESSISSTCPMDPFLTAGSQLSPSGSLMEKMSRTNLYIKGLPDSFTDEKLWNLPPKSAQIKSVKAATDDDGKCRGYGFIDFVSEDAANDALRHVRDTYPAFAIKFAKENEKDKTNLYITNLPKSWTTKDSDQLKLVFERFGPIQSAFVMMERSTNRTTGVGFVRFAVERDAVYALESLRSDHLILPECDHPVEAKFADKHNPDTRRRRYPISASLLHAATAHLGQSANASHPHLIGLPPLGNGGPPGSLTGPLTYPTDAVALHNLLHSLNPSADPGMTAATLAAIASATAVPNSSSLNPLHALQRKPDYLIQHLAPTGLLTAPGLSAKLHAAMPSRAQNNPHLDFGLTHPNLTTNTMGHSSMDAEQFNTALAMAALFGNGPATTADCGSAMMRNRSGVPGTLNGGGALMTAATDPISLIAGAGPTEAGLLDPSLLSNGLYRCPMYTNDFYRPPPHHENQQHHHHQQQQQQQQHQQLLAAAAMAASVNGNTAGATLYPSPIPELTAYLSYPNLIGPHQSHGTLNGSTVTTGCLGANMGQIYAGPSTNLTSQNTGVNGQAQNPNTTILGPLTTESYGLVTSRSSTMGMPHWVVANSMVKAANQEAVNLGQTCALQK